MRTRHFLYAAAVASLMLTSCAKDYADDLATINKRVDNLETRVSALEQWHSDNINALQQIINIQQSGSYISAITPLTTGDGYVMTFAGGQTFTIHNGSDGQDGHSPIIGVIQDTDGNWYWTVDGEFLLDGNGQKVRANGIDGQDGQNGQDGQTPTITINADGYWVINGENTGVKAKGEDGQDGQNGQDGQDGQTPTITINADGYWVVNGENTGVKAQGADGQNGQDGQKGQDGRDGQDGITPQIRINPTTFEWEISLDNGTTWTSTGVVAKGQNGTNGDKGNQGDAFFQSVAVGETDVTFTLADGTTTFTLPLMDTFKKVRDRVQSIVFIPENLDGMMTLQNGVQTTVRYRVMPEAVATALATNYASTLSFIGEEVAMTRSLAASAAITIDAVTDEGNGRLALTVTPAGMTADQGYAFALVMDDGTSMYSTAYTSVFYAIPPVAIGIAADAILAGKGYMTVGSTVRLIAMLVPTDTNMKGVQWTSSDTNIVTVDANGLATAHNNGTAVITVTSTAAPTVSKSITVTVSDGSITLNTDELVSQSDAE